MGPLGAQTRATCLAVLAVTLAIAAASGGVRLLPWVLDPRVPWGTVGVFARALTAAAVETATAIALPLGYALAAAAASDRGDARACLLVGASPLGLALRTWPLAAGVAAAAIACGASWGGARAAPLAVARELVSTARDACGDGRPIADVPGTGAAWLCAPGEPPRLALVAGDAVVLAERVTLARGTAALGSATLALRGPPEARVRVGEAIVRGLPSFDAPAGAPGTPRAIVLVLSTAVAALAIMAGLARSSEARRTVAALLGASSGALPLAVSIAIERRGLGAVWLGAIPIAALAPSLTLLLLGHRQRAALREVSQGGTS